MRDIWLVSDTHFHHKNILTFTDDNGDLIRPGFSCVEEMDEHMLEKWNSVVKQGDIVYHLGDVMMGDKDHFKKFWARLNGSKRLIVGNHDDIKFLANGSFFAKIKMWRVFKEFGLVLTHVPIHKSEMGHDLVNVHGHIHQNKSPTPWHYNVSVEALDDYTPVHIEQVSKEITENKQKAVT
jgi:calcineurin-like phosphoesterase family protein